MTRDEENRAYVVAAAPKALLLATHGIRVILLLSSDIKAWTKPYTEIRNKAIDYS